MIYLWLKAFHVIAIISWMAGLLYLPRLMVYHCQVESGGSQSETFKVMERRLLRAIMTPAMVGSWALGLLLAWFGEFWFDLWFWGKLAGVCGLTLCHFLLAGWVADFARDENRHGVNFYRIVNEVPTVLMIFVVVLVVLKP